MTAASIALALLVATPAHADSDRDKRERFGLNLGSITKTLDKEDRKEKRDNKAHATSTRSITGTVSAISGTTLTIAGKDAAVYSVNVANATFVAHDLVIALSDIKVGDTVKVKGTANGNVIIASKVKNLTYDKRLMLSKLENLRAGIVTSVSSGAFTITRFGTGTSATIATNASTSVKVNGKATTSAAITPGSAVVVVGTNGTSSPDSLTGTVVHVITKGYGWLKHFLFR